MLAMHYAIALASADQVAAVRARVVERGPLFDGMAGLKVKLFLIDAANPCYATFYLWRDASAALDFLEGPLFRALCDAFGRPEVRLLLTRAIDLPFAAGETVGIGTDPAEDPSAPIHAYDPGRGETVVLGRARPSGRRFEIAYRAAGLA